MKEDIEDRLSLIETLLEEIQGHIGELYDYCLEDLEDE